MSLSVDKAKVDSPRPEPIFSDSTEPSPNAMDERIIDLYLSTKLMDDPDAAKEKNTRLRRFTHHDKEIQSAKRITEKHSEQGVVFRVKIEGHEYCLKLFKQWQFQSFFEFRERTQMLHSPFAYECRAFARLIDIGENGTWAVKCHGWMCLSDEQFSALKPGRRHEVASCTRWAIIKDYIPNPFRVSDIPDICRKLSIPKRACITPEDYHPGNYRESFFVDLGSTKTFPCPLWGKYEFRRFYEFAEMAVKKWEKV